MWPWKKKTEAPCEHEWKKLPPVPPIHFLRECVKCGVRQGSTVSFERIEEAQNEPGESDR